jgi:acyl-CoA thioester hydrolase
MHETRMRVRFDEVDTMGVVHHPRYLVYFEVARTEYFRELGTAYRDVMAGGTHLAILEAGARYLRPAKYDDELSVETRCTEVTGARIHLSYVVRRGAETLATGFTRLGAVDTAGRAKRIPAEVRERFERAVEPDPQEAAPPCVQSRP